MGRYQAWIAAALLVVGLSSGMVVGAAVATAVPDDTAPSDTTQSETTQSEAKQPDTTDSEPDTEEPVEPDPVDETVEEEVAEPEVVEEVNLEDEITEDELLEDEVVEEEVVEEEVVEDEITETVVDDLGGTEEQLLADNGHNVAPGADNGHNVAPGADTVSEKAAAEETVEVVVDEPQLELTQSLRLATGEPQTLVGTTADQLLSLDLPSFASLAPLAIKVSAQLGVPPPHEIPIVNVVGSFVFDAIAFVMRIIEGPPVLPAGSTVTVRRSTLEIDGADGPVVPADWYFPDGSEGPPEGIIYLQHGFLASGPLYSYTAARLAEETNSIVVAPTLSSNIFAADQYWLGGEPMMEAVAGLFVGDREALVASAQAVDYTEPLPEKVVLIGHSLGGGLVVAAAGYMAENGSIDDLAGVITLDGVSFSASAVPRALTTLEETGNGDVPIHQIAAPPYTWNLDGQLADLLVEYRPGEFNGVTLDGGAHIDSMQGGNSVLQFAAYLFAGFSQPQNVAAVPILAAGWINDWYAGTDDGIYPAPGTAESIPTDDGPATAVGIGEQVASALQLAS